MKVSWLRFSDRNAFPAMSPVADCCDLTAHSCGGSAGISPVSLFRQSPTAYQVGDAITNGKKDYLTRTAIHMRRTQWVFSRYDSGRDFYAAGRFAPSTRQAYGFSSGKASIRVRERLEMAMLRAAFRGISSARASAARMVPACATTTRSWSR